MGWLDKKFKNVLSGAKDFAQSPAGMVALGIAAPYMASYMAPGAAGGSWMTSMAGKKGITGALAKGISSPIVSNALKNAAMNYGIATLTGSKHPGRSALWAAAASTPFTMMKSKAAADAFNKALKTDVGGSLLKEGAIKKANWWDFALGQEEDLLGQFAKEGIPVSGGKFQDILGPNPHGYGLEPTYTDAIADASFAGPTPDPTLNPLSKWKGTFQDLPISTGETVRGAYQFDDIPGIDYFTQAGGKELAEKAVTGQNPAAGIMGMLMPGNLDIMATLVPQIAGLYGGRMSDKEKWESWKKKRIKMLAWKYGIPEEDAERMITGEQVNPFYQTLMPEDYGDIEFYNQGGYADDYTGGGQAVGPGTGTSDSIQPVARSDDEFVFTKEATDNFPGGAQGLYSLMNSLDPDSETAEEARV